MSKRLWSRSEGGTLLARKLTHFKEAPGLVVLAVPPGGVPVAFEIARKLDAPLDVLAAVNLPVPGNPGQTLGAVARGGVRVLHTEAIDESGVAPGLVEQAVIAGEAELARREHAFRGWNRPLDLRGRTVILVDDGMATGATMSTAVLSAQRHGAERVIVAVPVASAEARSAVAQSVRDVICLHAPATFTTIGDFYDQFPRVGDQDVRDLLAQARQDLQSRPLFDIFAFAGMSSS